MIWVLVSCRGGVQNLISNGDFSQGPAPWAAKALLGGGAERELPLRLVDGVACASVAAQTELILGWPAAGSSERFEVVAGHSYQLSLLASASGAPLDCVAKLGHQLPPYAAVAVSPLKLTAALQAFQFPIVAERSDDRAGFALECRVSAATEVCLDDVVLAER